MKSSSNTQVEGALYVSMMLLVFPLFIWTDYTDITTMKMIAYLAMLLGFAGMLAVSFLTNRKQKQEQLCAKQPFRFSAVLIPDIFLLLFLVSGVVSWLVSPYFGQKNADGLDLVLFGAGRFDGVLFLASYALIYFLCSRYGCLRSYHIKAFSAIMFIMCGITIVQLSGVNLLNFYPPSLYVGKPSDFVSTIGNVDIMGGFMCMMLPLIGVGYVVFRLNRWISAFFLLVHTMGVYVMLSLGVDVAIVGLLALIAVMGPLLIRSRRYVCKLLEIALTIVIGWGLSASVHYTYLKDEKRTVTSLSVEKPAILALGLLILLLIVWWVLKHHKFTGVSWKRVRLYVIGAEGLAVIGAFCFFRFIYAPAEDSGLLYDIYELVRGQLSPTAGHNRVGIWRCSFLMAKEHLWFGTGTGTYGEAFSSFAPTIGYTRYIDRNLDFAHNEYIHYLCTMGISGLVWYMGFLISSAWQALKRLDENPKLLVLGAGVFGYSVQVFFSFSIVIVAPLFWMLLGLLMKEVRNARQANPEEASEYPQAEVTGITDASIQA